MTEKQAAVKSAAEAASAILTEAVDIDEVSAELLAVHEQHRVADISVVDATDSWELEVTLNPKQKKTVAKRSTGRKGKKPASKGVRKPARSQTARTPRRRKRWSSRYGPGIISDRFEPDEEYSDSEDESDYNERHGYESGKIRNVTKTGPGAKKRPKIDNTVDTSAADQAVRQLEADAKAIHDLIPQDSRSFGATTISTAVARRKDGRGFRKFIFCNIKGVLGPSLRAKAESLGYHVIAAPQAHAEGELIQYFKSREALYDLHSMGCDKEHCAECEWAMSVFFVSYQTEGSFSGKVFKNWYNPAALQEALGRTDAATPHRDALGTKK